VAADDKKSWREVDQSKNRSQKSDRRKSGLELRAEQMASKTAKSELEKLFSNSKVSKDKKLKLDLIRSKRGTSDYYNLIGDYCTEFGLPHDWEAQLLVLDHKDNNLVLELLAQLISTGPKLDIEQQKLLVQKLKVMEVSTFDPKLIDKIKEVKGALLVK